MLNFISEKPVKGRLIDLVHTIFELPIEERNLFIKEITDTDDVLIGSFYPNDGKENPDGPLQIGLERTKDKFGNDIPSRYYYQDSKVCPGKAYFNLSAVLSQMGQEILKVDPEEAKNMEWVNKLLLDNGLDKLKKDLYEKSQVSYEFSNKLLSIVTDDEALNKFLDFDNNQEFFEVDGNKYTQDFYLSILAKIFGQKGYKIETILRDTPFYSRYYVPNVDEIYERYSTIAEKINMERYIDPSFDLSLDEFPVGEAEDLDVTNSFTVNPEIEREILSDMPLDLTPEEKGFYVYAKMCKTFSYDEGYLYRKNLTKYDRYNDLSFKKEELEALKPGDKITCDQFSRLYANIINTRVATKDEDGKPDITARVIAAGINAGHYSTGFYTKRASFSLEAINGKTGGTNDLMKARSSIEFEGIKTISDKEGLREKAMDKIYPMVIGSKPVNIEKYCKDIREKISDKNLLDTSNEVDIGAKLEAFRTIALRKGMTGNEAIQFLATMNKLGFFGVPIDKSYIGEKRVDEKTGESIFRRYALIQRAKDSSVENGKGISTSRQANNYPIYLLDSDTLDVEVGSKEEIKDKLRKGLLVYEREDKPLPGLEMGE